VNMAKAENAEKMPNADRDDAIIVAVTRDGHMFLGSENRTPTMRVRKPLPATPRKRASSGLKRRSRATMGMQRSNPTVVVNQESGPLVDSWPSFQNLQRRKAIRKGTRGPGRNPYMMTLLYPERFNGVRYPDGYARKTCMAPLINEYEPPFFPSTSVIETPGDYWAVYRPSLVHPLWTYGPIPYATTGAALWCLGTDNARYGIETLNDMVPSPQEQCDQMFLASGVTYNLNMPLIYGNTTWVNDGITQVDANGNDFWGWPYIYGSNSLNAVFTCSVDVGGTPQTNDTIVINAFTAANPTGVNYTSTCATGTQHYTGNTAAAQALFTADPVYGTTAIGTGRANPLGFRITYTNVAGNGIPGITLHSAVIRAGGTGTYTAPTSNLMLYPTDWKDQANLLNIATNYRPVSASIWTQWIASTLVDGGVLSQIMYRGGAHPWQAAPIPYNQVNTGLLFWQGIGVTYGGWSDKAKIGGYSYYLPCSTSDTEMRTPINISEWTHPYVVVAGNIQANNVGTAGYSSAPLKFRYCANFEYVTTAQFTQAMPSVYGPELITAVKRALQNAPTSMDNDDHLTAIYNWIKNAGHDIADWGVRNKGWLVPAGQALFAGASMFL